MTALNCPAIQGKRSIASGVQKSTSDNPDIQKPLMPPAISAKLKAWRASRRSILDGGTAKGPLSYSALLSRIGSAKHLSHLAKMLRRARDELRRARAQPLA